MKVVCLALALALWSCGEERVPLADAAVVDADAMPIDAPDCSFVEEAGPSGALVAYEVGAGHEWMLTEPSQLWTRTADGWVERPLGVDCARGHLAVDANGHAGVACLARNGALWDLVLFEVGDAVTSSIVMAGQDAELETFHALPLSMIYSDARPYVLWVGAHEFQLNGYGGALSRRNAGVWSAPTFFSAYDLDLTTRVLRRGADLVFATRRPAEIEISRSTNFAPLVSFDIAATDFDVAIGDTGIHVLATDGEGIHYARRNALPPVDEWVDQGDAIAIGLDTNSQPVVAYRKDDGLHIARRTSGVWATSALVDATATRSFVRVDDGVRVALQRGDAITVMREECR